MALAWIYVISWPSSNWDSRWCGATCVKSERNSQASSSHLLRGLINCLSSHASIQVKSNQDTRPSFRSNNEPRKDNHKSLVLSLPKVVICLAPRKRSYRYQIAMTSEGFHTYDNKARDWKTRWARIWVVDYRNKRKGTVRASWCLWGHEGGVLMNHGVILKKPMPIAKKIWYGITFFIQRVL